MAISKSSEYRDEFLRSPMWQMIRESILCTKPMCERCRENVATDLHHVIYRKLISDTRVCDLVPLCRRCHDKVHRAIRFGLIPNPSDVEPKYLLKAISRTRKISDYQISKTQSYKQTKRYLCEDMLARIEASHPHVRKRCLGLLKCLYRELGSIKVTNHRIDLVRRLLDKTETREGLNSYLHKERMRNRR